ncbi:hypothetical protein OEZ85_000270 [Tetradesmus obliquus]|uniref:Uncharacterized protein n=1 Tax=Tetradesmus obliquus TaxID=3088 RepID=A0ABY8UVI0_TETOB|nr:hypothetical protein OEZ85_000270 [Tetradesmus obliquus]
MAAQTTVVITVISGSGNKRTRGCCLKGEIWNPLDDQRHKSAVQCSLTAAEPQVVQASSSSSSHATSSVVARPAQAPAEHSAQAVHEAACFPALWRSEWPGSGRRCRQLAAAVAQPSTPNPAPPPASPPIRRAACCTRPAPRHQQQHTRVD